MVLANVGRGGRGAGPAALLEPRFCTTPDGGTIAYATVGRGPALLVDFGWLGHFQLAWGFAPYRAFIERLAGNRTVVLHDKQGFGASRGIPGPLTVARGAGAIAAVAGHLRLERFDLLAALQAGPFAVAYAAANAAKVSRLVLYGTYGQGRDMAPPAVQASLVALVRAHWGIGSQTLSDLWLAGAGGAAAEWFAGYQRSAAGAELAAEAVSSCYGYDVRQLAAVVSTPTLVLHRRGDRAVPSGLGRALADAIPGARFIELEGRSHLPFVVDTESVLRPILDFLGVGAREIAAGAPPRLSNRERQVAGLVAEGLTNAEIASRLAISPRTAEAHLDNIRRKLGLRTRSQIATWYAG